ncbi:butyrophilin 3 [Labeo rohita]|uniref:Butyrophilin 3 n=1 Tax=Labeo rohita TaxID=84645 RepID=A0A498LZW4_LABRO|nr:butyrophilin 3 [Labeo rohita]
MKFICLTLLLVSGITDSRSEQYKVVGPADPVFVVAGEDVILPCSVKPSTSVVDMRVEWFRPNLKDAQLVHLYEDREDGNTDQIQSYRGRTKLIHQELQKGNASLKLSSVQISDEGRYKCFIQSKTWYDDATVNVSVEVLGRPPVITVDGFDYSGGLHLQCESEGWYPEPDLEWLNSEGLPCHSEMKFICLTLLIISGATDSRSEQYEVVGPADPVFAVAGEDVILPCSIKPSTSVANMTVGWTRPDQKDSLVHLYEDHEDRNTDQIQSYRGRTKLIHQELQKGNASLKLSSVRIFDEGRYKCFIQSKSWNDDTTVNVKVEGE